MGQVTLTPPPFPPKGARSRGVATAILGDR